MTTSPQLPEAIREASNTIWNGGTKLTHNEIDEIISAVVSQELTTQREELVDEIKWWLFDSGKFTNEDLLKYKKKFESPTKRGEGE